MKTSSAPSSAGGGIGVRCAKLASSFIAAIHARCLFLYLPIHTT
ncbi:hypothetical protein [Treponema endosymbiont of Eucomonympha sp.]|nr:hypothetical protein [Treponema endosymbiont of Eucomonympha sp.]